MSADVVLTRGIGNQRALCFGTTHGMNTGRGSVRVRIPLPLRPRLLRRSAPRRRRGPSETTSPGTFGTKEVTRAYVCPVRRCGRRWRQQAVAALLRELLDSMTPVEARDRAMAEIGGVAVAEEGGFN